MNHSIRALFSRPGIAGRAPEYISVRHSLAKHEQGLQMGLREASNRFLQPADGDGGARGCAITPSGIAEILRVLPAWVGVHDAETRTVEGVLVQSKISHTDFPLQPWHTYYDWTFHVRPDPQYTYLLSESNIHDHDGLFECEWDSAFLPRWAWPQDSDRVWIVGRWIYDCGHPEDHGHKTEIHPPKALASFRREAVQLPGNSDATSANVAVLYIGSQGGYWNHHINDQDYAFDLYLPPKPYPEAVPRWRIDAMTGSLPVQPQVTPFPAHDPCLLRVVIPLHGVTPEPQEYGALIAGGWSDPRGTESASLQRVRVTVNRIYLDGDYDVAFEDWFIYVGINGRWQVWPNIGGDTEELNFSVDLDLHLSDWIHITACGFEADLMHDYMGDDSGLTWSRISDLANDPVEREIVGRSLVRKLAGSLKDENDGIGYVSTFLPASFQGSQTFRSPKGDYRLSFSVAKLGAAIEVTPTSLEFGKVVVREEAVRTFMIKNTASINVNVSLPSSPPGSFFEWSGFSGILTSGQEVVIPVTFGPRAAGTSQTSLTVTSSAPGSPHTIHLSGTGRDDVLPQ